MNNKQLVLLFSFFIIAFFCRANETPSEDSASQGESSTDANKEDSIANSTQENKQREFLEKKQQKIEAQKLNFLEDEREEGDALPVTQLSSDTFDEVISKGFWFVGFVTPTCEACKHLKNNWPVLAREISKIPANNSATLQIAIFDLSTGEHLGERYGVENVPTMILFQNGKKIATYDLEAHRTIFSFLSFLQKHTSAFKHSPNELVNVIDASNLEKLDKGEWIVAFLVPWEAQSNKLSGLWYHLAQKVKVEHNTTLQVGLIFCVDDMKAVCQDKFKLESFPAVKYLDLEEKIQVSFAQDRKRDVQQFVEFLNVQMKDSPFSDFSYSDLIRAMQQKREPACIADESDDGSIPSTTATSKPKEEL